MNNIKYERRIYNFKSNTHTHEYGQLILPLQGVLYIETDSIGSFGSPTSDWERAMIANDVREILICIYSFSGKTDVEILLLQTLYFHTSSYTFIKVL